MNEEFKDRFYRALDILIKVLMVIILILSIVILAILIKDSRRTYASEKQKTISFEEAIDRDTEIAYQQWLATQTVEPVHDIDLSAGKYLIEVTDEDIDLMARVVMSEGSILSQEAKQAIATTIVNRVLVKSGEFAALNTVEEVVYHGKAYSTQDNGEPDETCYQAVYDSLMYEVFPVEMVFFREDCFHEFGYPYLQIGSTYFSTYKILE